uniref:Taste 1 receptor member 1 n=1 Tax=Latimeria chalumnae TaxID=7897 RepID=H3BAY4_LATCH
QVLMVLITVLLLLQLFAPSCLVLDLPGLKCSFLDFSLSGDYLIGGLFPIHTNVNVGSSSRPQVDKCQGNAQFNAHGYHLFQAMRFAVEEINNSSTLLPGLTLGYDIFDICLDSANLQATLDLLSQEAWPYVEVKKDLSSYRARVLALVGSDSSTYSFTIASILGHFLMPQVSYESTNERLSIKRLYPSFLRTIPSDKIQVEMIISLLHKFGWTWIAVIGSDNDYGQQGLQNLRYRASKNGICIAYQGVIPASAQQMRETVKSVLQTRVSIIVVFSTKQLATTFFKEIITQNITGKVWIGTEDWSIATLVSSLHDIKNIGTVIGASVKQAQLPGFLSFEATAVKSQTGEFQDTCDSVGSENYGAGTMGCNQECHECQWLNLDNMVTPNIQAAFNVYSAVYAVACALHVLLECDLGECSKEAPRPWQLLKELKQVSFKLYNTTIMFNENGDPPGGYDLVIWDWTTAQWSVKVIGSYSLNQGFEIDADKIKWHTEHNKVPRSVCSEECQPGAKRKQTGVHACCFDCETCPGGTFLNRSNLYSCQPCDREHWSQEGSEMCWNRTIEYLSWTDTISLMYLPGMALVFLLTLLVAVTFALNLDTPVVKSAGGRMCFIMLVSLAASCCITLCFFGKPTKLKRLLRLPVFISFTACLSCIAVRAFQIVCIFKMAAKLPKVYDYWVKKNGQTVFIIVSFLIQVVICMARASSRPPVPHQNYEIYKDQIILDCSENTSFGSVLVILYIGILSVLCFTFCYMGKDLPENYNEAKSITFSLLIYFISWISFCTTYIVYQGKYIAALKAMAILASVLGILGGYFLPKCYVILLKPQLNTEHFQTSIQSYTRKRSDQ